MSSSARMALVRSNEPEPVEQAPMEWPTESQIAALAYQLWVAKGCPLGTNREDWLLAEAMLQAVFAAIRRGPSSDPISFDRDSGVEEDLAAEVPWDGHWEVWEREWGGARWVCDVRRTA
ncbi:DUF2934 domain-containing protein [Paludibaculum fermentans]|uniref:DUF2934 domain-containing protein n=1 Tax=Paludibaculum fermentans TaxID=1473598 RepID=A0A7S7NPQ3_PALFE|nr:DUF2934 domain-containing protein [Paludibaculum fermentans]QOY87511.1 DUF2934 domain-containing protein [Paludibaculum fermentans]